eukprot:m.169705 g.169705  ORF g.169705 m.169705 type:complete len:918 (-) comp31584_c0_seq1:57-2810(-)
MANRYPISVLLVLAVSLPMVLSQSPIPKQIAPRSTVCAVYSLVHEYAQIVQNITDTQSKAVFDALALETCNQTWKPQTTQPVPKLWKRTSVGDASNVVYVDVVKGNDQADGKTLATPVKTIQQAQIITRKGPSPSTIFCRAGVYYLQATLMLTPEDNGLTIEAYNGEEVEFSGASPLGALTWEPYNVTNGSSGVMSLLPNVNVVEGATQNQNSTCFTYFGHTTTAQACSDACLRNMQCTAFTWHDGNQPAGSASWDNECYFVNTGCAVSQHSQTHHVSGIKTVVPPMNVYVAHNVDVPPTMTGLRVGGKRAIRARWPNGDPEYQLFPQGWVSPQGKAWGKPKQYPIASDIINYNPNRSTEGPCSSSSGYCYYATGVGGACAGLGYEPPSGYWCAAEPPRGTTYSTAVPSSLTYTAADFDGRAWTKWKANESVVNAFRNGHWFSYVFLLDGYDAATQQMSWTVGGFQGGEGSSSAAEWNVENVFEELDSPNEWYYDTTSSSLYWFYNGTGTPGSDLEFDGTKLEQLIVVNGSGTRRGETGAHVSDISIRGIKFSGTTLTTLAPHGLPSDGGGDWAISRRGAVHITGAERTTIEDCLFDRIDGNGVMISGYSRNTTVKGCEFHLVGENGVVSWGYTADFADANRTVPIPRTQGPDATDGNHPQGNMIISNFFHEIGHFQKQVSCYFQAQTQQSTLANNICFNGPRAGVNFNDGMGGGNLLSKNVIFNMVRETQDHGSFNSWDRQPFYVQRDGVSTYVPLYNEITGNFWMNDYNPQEAVDNDDGSAYYETHHNVFAFASGGLKNDFGGHDNHHHNNIYYNSGGCMGVCAQLPGHEDAFYNNTCIINKASPQYAGFSAGIGGPAYPVMHDNKVLTLDGMATESGKSIAAWQNEGHDLGTTVGKLPSDDALITMARALLNMN